MGSAYVALVTTRNLNHKSSNATLYCSSVVSQGPGLGSKLFVVPALRELHAPLLMLPAEQARAARIYTCARMLKSQSCTRQKAICAVCCHSLKATLPHLFAYTKPSSKNILTAAVPGTKRSGPMLEQWAEDFGDGAAQPNLRDALSFKTQKHIVEHRGSMAS